MTGWCRRYRPRLRSGRGPLLWRVSASQAIVARTTGLVEVIARYQVASQFGSAADDLAEGVARAA